MDTNLGESPSQHSGTKPGVGNLQERGQTFSDDDIMLLLNFQVAELPEGAVLSSALLVSGKRLSLFYPGWLQTKAQKTQTKNLKLKAFYSQSDADLYKHFTHIKILETGRPGALNSCPWMDACVIKAIVETEIKIYSSVMQQLANKKLYTHKEEWTKDTPFRKTIKGTTYNFILKN